MKRLHAAAALLLLSSSAAAQDLALPEDIVVTATRYERPAQDLPARVTVVTAADLQRESIETIDEALAFVAGVTQARADGDYSFKSVVSLRGMSSAQQGRTLVLLDGVPINTAATGEVNWNRIPVELVDRIEVFKGPGSSIYGGSAIGGVINVITRRPGRKLEGYALAEAASYNTEKAGALAAAKSSGPLEGLYTRVWGALAHSDGYISNPAPTSTTIKRYYQENNGAALAGWDFKGGRLEYEYTNSDDRRGEGMRILAPEGVSRMFPTETHRLSAEGQLGDGSWRLLAYRQQELYGRLSESGTPSAYSRIDTTVDRRDYNVSGSVTQPLGLGQKVTLGGEFKAGRVNGIDRSNVDIVDAGKMDTYAFYLQDDASLGDGLPTILASLRYDAARFYQGSYNNPTNPSWATVSGPLPAQNWGSLTWRGSARQRLGDDLSAYLSYSQGFRQPNLEDMVETLLKGKGSTQFLMLANPNLRPERVDTYELGADYTPLAGFKFSPSVYYSWARDFIYSVNTNAPATGFSGGQCGGNPCIYQSQNMTAVDILGAEAEASYSAGPATLSASYSFASSRIRHFLGNTGREGKYLADAPLHQAGAVLAWRFPWVNTAASWRFKGAQYYDDANTVPISPYSTLGFKLWRPLGQHATASLALENALDNRYQESPASGPYADMAPGRYLKGAVTWSF